MSCQPSKPGQRDVQDDQVGLLVVEPAQRVGAGSRGDRPVAGAVHPQLDQGRELGLVLDDEDRLSHPPRLALGGGSSASGRVNRTRCRRRPSGRSSHQPTTVRLDQPPADEQPEARARDARLADVPGAVERLGDETRSASGMPTPSSSTVTASHAPSTVGTDHDRAASGRVLARVADEVLRAPGRPARRRPRPAAGRPAGSTTSRSAPPATSSSPRRRATRDGEGRRRSLEDQWIGLEVGHVEDLVDERSQSAAGLVDPLDVARCCSGSSSR